MVKFSIPKHHWNYYLAIENDLKNITSYVDFSDENLDTYSIKFVQILLSASSEVDVILKQLCTLLDNTVPANNIDDYRQIIQAKCPEFIDEEIIIKLYGMEYTPWITWHENVNPNWWRSYNNVKHERNIYFKDANLKNTINAMGGLLISVLYFYKYQFSEELGHKIEMSMTTNKLNYNSGFIEINNDDYY